MSWRWGRPRRPRWWRPRPASSCGPWRSPPGSPPEASRPSGAPTRERLLAGSAALPAGALEKLLVLLLPHALAALLDPRTHGGGRVSRPALVWSTRSGLV